MSVSTPALAIISFLVSVKQAKSLTEISKNLFISPSTAYRVLSSLKISGWVVRDDVTKRYRVGNRLIELALSLVSQLDLRNVGLHYLELLYSKVEESVMLSARVGLERMYIEQIQCNHELRHIVELGRHFPLWVGAPGKVILAHMEQHEIEVVLNSLKKSRKHFLASGQAVNINNLWKELTKIRNQGFSISKGERIPGTVAMAAPIFGRDNRVLGAISTGGPESRFTIDMAIGYGPLVNDIAKKISLQLGNIPQRN